MMDRKKTLAAIARHVTEADIVLPVYSTAFDWIDLSREFVPHTEKLYSWWSYRAKDWEKSDRGRSLDHIWASQGLRGAAKSHAIVKPPRGWKRASDHVPVMVEFDLAG